MKKSQKRKIQFVQASVLIPQQLKAVKGGEDVEIITEDALDG